MMISDNLAIYVLSLILLCAIFCTEYYLNDRKQSRILLRRVVSAEIMLFVILILFDLFKDDIDTNVPTYVLYAIAILLWVGCVCHNIGGKYEKINLALMTVFAIAGIVLYILCETETIDLLEDIILTTLLISPALISILFYAAGYIRSDDYWRRRDLLQMIIVNIPLVIVTIVSLEIETICIIPAALLLSVFLYYVIHIYNMIILDPTGVYGPAYMSDRISKATSKRPNGMKIVVAMCQVGGNKEVIDQYGHREGNRVFQAFADSLKDATSGTDVIVGRYWASKYVLLKVAEDQEELTKICMDVKDRCFHIADGHPYELRPCCAIGEVTSFEDLDKLMAEIEKEYLYDYLHVD